MIGPTVNAPKLVAWLAGWSPADGGTSKRNRSSLKLIEAIDQLRERRLKLLDSFPTTMVMMERRAAKRTHVRLRGVYDNYGDVVESNTPGVFPALPVDGPANRLDFANWLVNGSHPLTARVIVNRYWQNFFGTGTGQDGGRLRSAGRTSQSS